MTVASHRCPRVSVIIPVYNAVDHLPECLESITGQSIGLDSVEVVVVDDGSTDGSGALLDEWAARHPQVIRVVHQENSGAPGGPRNRAIALASGEFLFFADPDDYLGTEALERMVAAADRNDSDVVLGRIAGVGRTAPTVAFKRNVEGGDLFTTNGVWTLTAHKLFRRSMVMEHNLRFAEGVRLAEEQMFIMGAYFAARSVSVVADYDCYYLVRRDDFPHLTQQLPEPASFFGNVGNVLDLVAAHVPPGEKRNKLLNRWLTREILGRFAGRFATQPEETRELYVKLAGELISKHMPDELIAALPPLSRLRCRLLTARATDELTALTTLVPKPKPEPKQAQPAQPAKAAMRFKTLSRLTPRRIARSVKRRLAP
ncbi:glycosyltransferase [Streptomyces sp. NK08204]|uniref:glycosyltransferase family 2 protein n=1 Tax=Streptomyces sp. NK08204 TaxID=2873260 RepID=UPI001CED9B54|nr:glycosyltransferase [Streptomyces sp. NK08204]